MFGSPAARHCNNDIDRARSCFSEQPPPSRSVLQMGEAFGRKMTNCCIHLLDDKRSFWILLSEMKAKVAGGMMEEKHGTSDCELYPDKCFKVFGTR